MILTIILLIISFLFEGFISNYLNISFLDNNYFSTLYTLITLIIKYLLLLVMVTIKYMVLLMDIIKDYLKLKVLVILKM